jgi:hypothetical protein
MAVISPPRIRGTIKDRVLGLGLLLPRPLRRMLKTRVAPPALRALRRMREPNGAIDAAPVRSFRVAGCETFAGYYDVSPISPDGCALLAHATSLRRRSPGVGDNARIGWFDLASGAYHDAGETRLWNWQMGARLRWWQGEPDKALAYNGLLDARPALCLARAGGEPVQLFPRPLFDVSRDQRTGVALNFGRLARCRPGYGYPAMADPFADDPCPSSDGIVIADLASGTSRLAFSLADFAELIDEPVAGAFHYLNAASLSPAGSRFSVLHKYLPDAQNVHKWVVCAVVGSSDGSNLARVPLRGNPSHYWWIDEDRIVYTGNSGVSSIYQIYDCRDRSVTPFSRAAPEIDGHPSCQSGRANPLWVTDQYPDLYAEQALFLFRADDARPVELARFAADPRYQDEWRCDLHPRWSDDGGCVVIDSTHEGHRAIYAVTVTEAA